MNQFESGASGERKETKFEAMIRKLREEGYEFDTAESESVFTVKVPDKEIGITKIPGVDTEDGWMSFNEIVENSIKESAPRKEPLPPEQEIEDTEKREGL